MPVLLPFSGGSRWKCAWLDMARVEGTCCRIAAWRTPMDVAVVIPPALSSARLAVWTNDKQHQRGEMVVLAPRRGFVNAGPCLSARPRRGNKAGERVQRTRSRRAFKRCVVLAVRRGEVFGKRL